MTIERHLGVVAADEPDSRIELVQVAEPNATPTVELRLQRHCDDLGWVIHKRMRLAAGQVSDLTRALNMMDPDAREADIGAADRGAARCLHLVDDVAERSSG